MYADINLFNLFTPWNPEAKVILSATLPIKETLEGLNPASIWCNSKELAPEYSTIAFL